MRKPLRLREERSRQAQHFGNRKPLPPFLSIGIIFTPMIQIGDVLVSDDVVEAKFVCDLARCKGGCCEDGDAGA